MNLIDTLKPLRSHAGKVRTAGLDDATVLDLAGRYPELVEAVEAAVAQHAPTPIESILLTAAAASLALIPIARQVFWGPMAYAMMGGIIAGTLITLLFAPALYCAVFRLKPPASEEPTPN